MKKTIIGGVELREEITEFKPIGKTFKFQFPYNGKAHKAEFVAQNWQEAYRRALFTIFGPRLRSLTDGDETGGPKTQHLPLLNEDEECERLPLPKEVIRTIELSNKNNHKRL